MLIELAIGDAYGAGFEYVDPATVRRHNTLRGYVQHPRHRIRPGAYTDDTQMSLAIAETLISGADWTPPVLAEAFVTAFHRDPRDGYTQGTQHCWWAGFGGRSFAGARCDPCRYPGRGPGGRVVHPIGER